MYRYNKLMVAINFNSADHSLLAYASHIAKLARSSKVYFVHFSENLEIPSDIREEYPSLIEPLDEYALRRMKELAMRFFSNLKNLDLSFEVGEGDQVSSFLRLIKIKDIDLVLVGKNTDTQPDHYLGEKLARKAPCSVLVIPSGAKPSYKNIAVASDFSEHSLNAMDVGRAFASSAGILTIDFLHVFDIPSGYYKTGKSYEQFTDIMKGHAKKQFEMIMKNLNINGVSSNLKLLHDGKPARAIEEFVRETGTDLLIMGARGRANGAGILLGSVTEKLIGVLDVPLLAVKKKGAGLDILDAILNR
jgi:nucleotide-binding universal stress UspA family protein